MLGAFAWPIDGGPAPLPRAAGRDAADGRDRVAAPALRSRSASLDRRGPRDILFGDPPRPVLTVRGILLDGAVARVLIDDGSGSQAWLARGEGRGDWRVIAVGRDEVTLVQGERRYVATFLGTRRPCGPWARSR